MRAAEGGGRENQKKRTRKDLLEAAARLVKAGRRPTLEEVADEAMVSRATAYRYFPSQDALLAEAAVDVAIPDPDEVLREAPALDAVARLHLVDAALHETVLANEAALRLMLAHSVQRALAPEAYGDVPPRQDRRTPMIQAALSPARARLDPKAAKLLTRALALVIGTEAMVVFKDVLRLDDAESRKVKRWAIRALVDAATRQTRDKGRGRAPRRPLESGR